MLVDRARRLESRDHPILDPLQLRGPRAQRRSGTAGADRERRGEIGEVRHRLRLLQVEEAGLGFRGGSIGGCRVQKRQGLTFRCFDNGAQGGGPALPASGARFRIALDQPGRRRLPPGLERFEVVSLARLHRQRRIQDATDLAQVLQGGPELLGSQRPPRPIQHRLDPGPELQPLLVLGVVLRKGAFGALELGGHARLGRLGGGEEKQGGEEHGSSVSRTPGRRLERSEPWNRRMLQ